jgi:hypothetical protein
LLLKFFIILVTSPEADLGFDTNVERIGESDFDVQFSIEGMRYPATKLLFDIGADAPRGRGLRVFEVKDLRTGGNCVIKDCWVGDCLYKEMEHDIVAKIKRSMGDEEFCNHFIDIYGYHKKDMSGGFGEVCKLLKTGTFESVEGFEPELLVPPTESRPSYTSGAPVTDQGHYLRSTKKKAGPAHPPHSQFRYQIVYKEKGISLFEVTSLDKVFKYISQAAEGAARFN